MAATRVSASVPKNLHSGFRPAVEWLYAEAMRRGLYNWRIVSGYRSMEEQLALYKKGRTKLEVAQRVKKTGRDGSVTDAYPGESPHNYGLAIDGEGPDWPRVKAIAAAAGFGTVSWDPPHLEHPAFASWRRGQN